MKYSIDGIVNDRIIKNVTMKENFIVVSYMDGTSDCFDKTTEIENKVRDKVEKQAGKYVENYDKSIKKLSLNKWLRLAVSLFVAILAALFAISNLTGLALIIGTSSVFTTFLGYNTIEGYKNKKMVEDLEKYQFYFKNRTFFENNYTNVIDKELELKKIGNVPTKNTITKVDLYNIDTVTYDEMLDKKDKFDRYSEIDPTIKVKKLGNYPNDKR